MFLLGSLNYAPNSTANSFEHMFDIVVVVLAKSNDSNVEDMFKSVANLINAQQ
jgi:hypothetical protein